jgi:DegV family protein with EDD domain
MIPHVRVLVDSTAGISPELAAAWGVGIVPLYLKWGDQHYRDGVDLLPSDFYSQLARYDHNPITAAPNPQDFALAYQEALTLGYQQILVITVSIHMSATYQNANLAAEAFGRETVAVLDSGQGAGAQALIAAYAAQVAEMGSGLFDVMEAARVAGESTQLFLAINTLKYLRRSGRVSRIQASMGELIRLKPIMTFRNGHLEVLEKTRTMQHAIARLQANLTQGNQPAEHILIMYADTPTDAGKLREEFAYLVPDARIDLSPVSYIVGAHTGPGLLGFAVRRRS